MFKKILHRPLWLLLSGVLLVAGVSALLLLHFGASGSAYGQGPRLLAGPNSAGPGSTIPVTGFEFPASTNVQGYFQSLGNCLFTAPTTALAFLFFPVRHPALSPATGGVGRLSASSRVHRHAVIHTSPTFGPVGTEVHVKGRGFGSNKIVTVFFQGKQVAKARTNDVGDFSATFIVPRSATLKPSFNAVQATDGKAIAATSFQVLPSVTIHPSSVEPGQKISLNGSQFTPDGPVSIYLQDLSNPSSVGIPLCHVRASDRATFDIDCVIPHGLKSGKVYAIIVVDVKTGISVDINFFVRK